MSFAVSVVQPHVSRSIDLASASQEEIDVWLRDEQLFTVYEAAIASDSAFHTYYATLAFKLDLHLLKRVYEHGLLLNIEDDLSQLLRETEILEGAWHQRNFETEWRDELHGASRWADLREGATALKYATRMALEHRLELHLG